MGIVVSVAEKIGENLVNSISKNVGENVITRIQEHVGYVIYYDSNMKTLKAEVDKLGVTENMVKNSIDEAKKNGQCIVPGVDSWLTTSNQMNEEVKKFLEDEEATLNKRWLGGLCPDLISRYNLSWEAKKKTQNVIGLLKENIWFNYTDFESRISIMEEIMVALKDDEINAIGICGLGGVGKTTMVEKVRERAKAEKLFDEIVMTVVTQTPDEKKIQDEIARKLDLKFNENDDLRERAVTLRNKVMDCKRLLVILDDVWKRLELEKVGIPVGGAYKGCKVVVTSRSINVCEGMGTCRNFPIGVLTEAEAWNLFRQKAGDSIDSPGLNQIAKEVIKECGGLPIAIVTIGAALKGTEEPEWRDALLQLKNSNPGNISELRESVFPSIKFSYDFLKSQEAKSCLLLCCLFKEDATIAVEDLVKYGMGLDLFTNVDTLEKARDRVHGLVNKLKGSYLLLEGHPYWEKSVRVHDVVRDVIRFIATEGKEEVFMYGDGRKVKAWLAEKTDEEYTSLSLISNKVDDRLDCTKLELLQLMEWTHWSESPKAPDNLFEGMKELRVLHLSGVAFLPSPPRSLSLLTKLRTLYLCDCELENVSAIGELKELLILSFHNSSLDELPQEIGNLIHLRMLDLTNCGLERISPGVISNLKRLEELYLVNSGVASMCHGEHPAMSLRELRRLDLRSLPELMHLWKDPTKVVSLRNLRHVKVEQCHKLENLFSQSTASGLEQLEVLQIQHCEMIEEIIAMEKGEHGETITNKLRFPKLSVLRLVYLPNLISFCKKMDEIEFPQLSTLFLDHLPKLSSLCPNIPASEGNHDSATQHLFNQKVKSMCELRSLRVDSCDKLLNVFSSNLVQSLWNLEELSIWTCDLIEVVFDFEGINIEEGRATLALTCLKKLEFISLPKLTHLWKEVPLGFQGVPNLRSLEIEGCWSLKSIFTPYIAENLLKLEELHVRDCAIMEIVGKDQEGKAEIEESTKVIVFSQLKQLRLQNLPDLMSFGPNLYTFEFTVLEKLSLYKSNMKVFIPSILGTRKQRTINVRSHEEVHEQQIKFPSLEVLTLNHVQGILDGQLLAHSSCKLREICVEECKELLAVPSNWLPGLQKLEALTIQECDSLVAVFEVEGLNVEERYAVLLPKLKKLCLSSLPKLEKLLFPTCLFRNLKSLYVRHCHNLRNLFSPSMARALVHLQRLWIENCKMMEEIVVKGENEEADRMDKIVIPQLQRLYLYFSPNLTSFCQSPYAFDLPLLEDVRVWHCPKMKTFSLGSLSTPKLQQVIPDCFWMGDLNNTIQVLFQRNRKEEDFDDEDDDADCDDDDDDEDEDEDEDDDDDDDNDGSDDNDGNNDDHEN